MSYAESLEGTVKEVRKSFAVIITLESHTPSATTDAENVALLTTCTQYNWGKRRLCTGVLARELLKSCSDVVS
jgi:hypothetical protein